MRTSLESINHIELGSCNASVGGVVLFSEETELYF